MPTDIIKKVGVTNSPTTMDYSSVQAWNDAAPSNLVSADERWIGECYNQGTFTAIATIGSGWTVDATHYFWLRTAAGASFRDNASVRSNALYPNASNGVTWQIGDNYNYVLVVWAANTVLSYLQFVNTGFGGAIRNNTSAGVIDSCLIRSAVGSGAAIYFPSTMYNTVVIVTGSSGSCTIYQGFMYGCTFVSANGSSGACIQNDNYNSSLWQNCACFGFASLMSGSAALNASSDYNATDLATSFGAGTHNRNSLTYASQFVSTTSDYRAVNTGSLAAGLPDSTHLPVDISNFTRSATTPYIGAWEVAGAAAAFVAAPGLTVRQAVKRASLY